MFNRYYICDVMVPYLLLSHNTHLKKTNTDADELKNYRPVSNLHFISKVLEKLVVKRLKQHFINHSLNDPLQSAYRVAGSTETAIIKIHNDTVNGIDKAQCTILASLDLSAAFDTVDHDIFIGKMHAYLNFITYYAIYYYVFLCGITFTTFHP